MAKIIPGNIAPDALPRVRGHMYARSTRYGVIAQAWPKKRGKPKDWNTYFLSTQFAKAAQMSANPEPLSYQTALFISHGTDYLPRDVLVRAAYGKLYEIVLPDGTVAQQASHGAPPEPPSWP